MTMLGKISVNDLAVNEPAEEHQPGLSTCARTFRPQEQRDGVFRHGDMKMKKSR